jgi:flagellar motility protein MotE (MotC chaperone)
MQIAVQLIHEQALKKKIIEQTRKLKQQQSVYDSARDERNAYSKSLLEVEGDIAGISRQFKNMTKMVRLQVFFSLRSPLPGLSAACVYD